MSRSAARAKLAAAQAALAQAEQSLRAIETAHAAATSGAAAADAAVNACDAASESDGLALADRHVAAALAGEVAPQPPVVSPHAIHERSRAQATQKAARAAVTALAARQAAATATVAAARDSLNSAAQGVLVELVGNMVELALPAMAMLEEIRADLHTVSGCGGLIIGGRMRNLPLSADARRVLDPAMTTNGPWEREARSRRWQDLKQRLLTDPDAVVEHAVVEVEQGTAA